MKLKSMIYLCMEKMLAPCTDRIVCISEAERASALREHIAGEDKLERLLKSCPVKYMVYRDDHPEELKQLDALQIEDFLCVMHPVINTNNK